MQQFKITGTDQRFFKEAWELYEESFPIEERRTLEAQTKLMDHQNYNFEVIVAGDEFIGLLFWWGFDELRYFEHFATMPGHRGKGFGKSILQNSMHSDDRKVLLEVELPENELKQRRIKFYERCGFYLNDFLYHQPALRDGFGDLELLLMSYPHPVTPTDIVEFKEKCHPVIYS